MAPGVQATQVELEVAPAALEYVPAGHRAHGDAPVDEYEPGAHCVAAAELSMEASASARAARAAAGRTETRAGAREPRRAGRSAPIVGTRTRMRLEGSWQT